MGVSSLIAIVLLADLLVTVPERERIKTRGLGIKPLLRTPRLVRHNRIVGKALGLDGSASILFYLARRYRY
jgi:hypothetical protein